MKEKERKKRGRRDGKEREKRFRREEEEREIEAN